MTAFRLIGPGRAGRSLLAALDAVGGYQCQGVLGRGQALAGAAEGVDLLVIATPDDEVARVASLVRPTVSTVVLHLSGSLGLDVLEPHVRRASLHPLVPLPTAEVGAERLCSGIAFAVAGHALSTQLAMALGGQAFEVDDHSRAAYHAAAAIAANHQVALIGQVERVAATAGLPLAAFAGLLRAAADDALELGPRQALTGPAARGDWDTVERHRTALSAMAGHRTELAGYDAMVGLARRLSIEEAEPQPAQSDLVSGDVDPAADLVAEPAAVEQVA